MRNLLTIIAIIFLFGCGKESTSSDSTAFATSGGKGGSLARFTVVGDYLYTVDRETLKVFDISNPQLPVLKRSVKAGFEIETIFPFKDKLFLGSTSVVCIFSLDDPSNPQKLSEAISPNVMRRCDPVVAKDNVAYATLRSNGPCGGTTSILAVYDITDVTKPVQKASIQIGEPYGLGYSGNILYVCDRFYGFSIFDISHPYQPSLLRSVKISYEEVNFIDVIPYNNILVCWTSKGMTLYDISDPQDPLLIKQIN
ncbi:MAG TPA: hypothetical protein VNT20_01995 [Flavisolibacter sp.]|jgi:hypothetical protein|nr:hypothetical protein [Flavisolibacter sp.]